MEKLKKIKIWVIEQVIWAEQNLRDKTGADKKAAVIRKLDDLIKLPFYLEWIDDVIISLLVDQACAQLNKVSAHNFGNVELNSVDEARIADKITILGKGDN
ncbi:MAG: hypothetical protein IJ597_05210 [Synergistaceae bacterium]|nr:hypothetical protein [Synergistaceae bacterium]